MLAISCVLKFPLPSFSCQSIVLLCLPAEIKSRSPSPSTSAGSTDIAPLVVLEMVFVVNAVSNVGASLGGWIAPEMLILNSWLSDRLAVTPSRSLTKNVNEPSPE